jgi:hypothetical protein
MCHPHTSPSMTMPHPNRKPHKPHPISFHPLQRHLTRFRHRFPLWFVLLAVLLTPAKGINELSREKRVCVRVRAYVYVRAFEKPVAQTVNPRRSLFCCDFWCVQTSESERSPAQQHRVLQEIASSLNKSSQTKFVSITPSSPLSRAHSLLSLSFHCPPSPTPATVALTHWLAFGGW